MLDGAAKKEGTAEQPVRRRDIAGTEEGPDLGRVELDPVEPEGFHDLDREAVLARFIGSVTESEAETLRKLLGHN